ncbi:MAG: VOC family protein [Pseudomonadota bacterium]
MPEFLWTDLSTFDLAQAKADYEQIFGWRFDGSGDYSVAQAPSETSSRAAPWSALREARAIAAAFPMPEALAARGMPSFWMSYVGVADLDVCLAATRAWPGATIELGPEPVPGGGRFALIRDPAGAGFSVLEGGENWLSSRAPGPRRFYHAADPLAVAGFYADLFGWRLDAVEAGPAGPRWSIRCGDARVATAEAIPDALRGPFTYWIPAFPTHAPAAAVERLRGQGGALDADLGDGRLLLADRQGARFVIERERAA